jgi:predicted O-methyltransferase YrrM
MIFKDHKCWKEIERIRERHGNVRGNFSLYPEKSQWLHDLVSENQPKRILETGFNCGHSTTIMLTGCPNASVTTFDLCDRSYSSEAFDVISDHFDDVRLIKGDSKETLPTHMTERDVLFDFVLVDGGHDYETAKSDLSAIIDKISVGGLILIDDLNLKGVKKAVNEVDLSKFELVKIHKEQRKYSSGSRRINNVAHLYRRVE